jgi:pimeloyl-ACP methyl ester carboxylesterase
MHPTSKTPLPPIRSRGPRGPARTAAAVVLSAILLAACGSLEDDDAVAPPPAAAPGAGQGATPDPAWLTSSEQVTVLTKAALDAASAQRGWSASAGPARCDVTLHEVVHPTVGPKGEATDASGVVLVPSGPDCPGPYPLLSYSRGTDTDRSRSLAVPDDRELQAIAAFFAARGFVVVASDYLGYARSSFPYHPYLQAESVARTNLDAMRASRILLGRLGIADSGKVFLTGYSQGGHAALATQRAIERDRPPGFAVTATGAMSGPYDLAGSFGDAAALLPLLLADLGDSSLGQAIELRLGDVINTTAGDLLRESARLREVLTANSVLGWTPQAPVLLCGGSRDPLVPFSNTTRTAADFAARGAPPTVVDVEQEPAFAPLLPPADAPVTELGSYHQGEVPPLCFQVVRDRLLAPRI